MRGGSFDPIHNAHLILARLAVEQLQLDRVLFTVAGSQPFKRGLHAASADQRLHMVKLALDGIPDCVADGRELLRPVPSYTVDTLRELNAEQPAAELVLIMGADVARGFSEWRDPQGVKALARIAVCARDESTAAGLGLRALGSQLFATEIQVPTLDISSTELRARAAAGLPLDGWVPAAVADYIVASQLYRSPAG